MLTKLHHPHNMTESISIQTQANVCCAMLLCAIRRQWGAVQYIGYVCIHISVFFFLQYNRVYSYSIAD